MVMPVGPHAGFGTESVVCSIHISPRCWYRVLAQPQPATLYDGEKPGNLSGASGGISSLHDRCCFTGALSNVYFHKTSGMISLSASDGGGANVDKSSIIP